AKLRMLNGAHSTIAYLGLFHGYETVDAAMADRRIAAVVDQLMREAESTLPPIAGLDPQAYATALQARFCNPALQHRLAQIAMDGSQKIPQRLLGTMADVHAAGGTPRAAATGVAAWLRHFSSAHLNDPLADRLRAAVSDDVAMLVARALSIESIFGPLGRQQWCRDLIVEMMP
ncbi:MAG: mannitol dehydrogenase, partial [Zymomonas sp.]|nr:mannitol dehydrogenase [Zymomonas sp.]